MKRRRIVIVLAVALVAGAAFGAWWWYRRNSAEEPLLLAGTLEARSAEVGSLVGGRVAALHAEEGQAVEAGALLVSLEPDLLEPQLAEQRARVAEARALLTRAERGPREEEVERARLAWENAATERRRLAPLRSTGVVSQRQYDDAVLAEQTAEERYRELERGTRVEDVAAAAAVLEREEGRLAYLERQLQELEIRAPLAGVIEVLDLRPGDLVAAGAPVATLLEAGELTVRVYVPEPQLGRVRVGQEARVTVDTWPEREFPGRVVEIRDRAEYTPRNVQTLDQRADQVFGVKVAVAPAPELKAGMAALVRLVETAGVDAG